MDVYWQIVLIVYLVICALLLGCISLDELLLILVKVERQRVRIFIVQNAVMFPLIAFMSAPFAEVLKQGLELLVRIFLVHS